MFIPRFVISNHSSLPLVTIDRVRYKCYRNKWYRYTQINNTCYTIFDLIQFKAIMHIFIFIDQYNDYSDGKMCKYRMIDLLLLNTE